MNPGLAFSVALLTGTTAGVVTVLRPADAMAAAFAAAAIALVLPSRRFRAASIALVVALAAAAHGAAARDRALHPPIAAWFDHAAAGAERLTGIIEIEGVLAADASVREDAVGLMVDVARVRPAAGAEEDWVDAPGRVLLHVAGGQAASHVREWTAGRRVRAPASLRWPQMLLNFGGPSPFWQRLRRPFAIAGSVKSAALVEVERGAWWREWASRARWRVRDATARFVTPHHAQAGAVVTAILIGDRAGLSDSVERGLQAAGTYHVIAISGGNVALLTMLCYAVLRLLLRRERPVAALTLCMVLTYGLIVGGDPSVARAVTAASLYLGAVLLRIAPDPTALLRTAACVLAVADPVIVSDAGAWLSFGATLGILLWAAPLASLVPWSRLPARASPMLRPIATLVAATIGAELMITPIAAAVFQRVTVAGLLMNLIAIPAMAVAQIAGLIVAMGGIAPGLAASAGSVAAIAARTLLATGDAATSLPALSWRVPSTTLVVIAAYYAALALVVARSNRRWRFGVIALAGALLVTIVTAPATARAQPTPNRLRLSVIDVGQGDAILLQMPSGKALLIDAGGTPGSFDIGGRVVTPAVWAFGARHLDWFAISHGDRDHMGGAPGVIEDLAPGEIWEGVPVPPHAELTRLKESAAARGIAWRTLRAGARLEIAGVTIDTVHPLNPEWERQKVRNDDSIVLRVRYGRVEFLLTGDAGAEFEGRWPADEGGAAIRILKAGHHGSRTSTGESLVRAWRPHAALISAGRANLFGHPAPDVVARLQQAGAEIFRTDRDGAISLETDGVTVRVRTALGRVWTVVAPNQSRPS